MDAQLGSFVCVINYVLLRLGKDLLNWRYFDIVVTFTSL